MKSLLMYIEGDKFEDKMKNLRLDIYERDFNWMDFLKQQYEFLKIFINNKLIIESNIFRNTNLESSIDKKVNESTKMLIEKTSNNRGYSEIFTDVKQIVRDTSDISIKIM